MVASEDVSHQAQPALLDGISEVIRGESIKILVARCDRLGDVILSTPAIRALKENYPKSKLILMVRKNIAPIVETLSFVDEVKIYDPDGVHAGVKGFFRLMRELRVLGISIAVVMSTEPRLAAALYGIGVPYRVGPLSKPHSYWFYNRGVRQRRSLVEMHEADYNLQLLRRLGIRAKRTQILTETSTNAADESWARGFLAHDKVSLIGLHPGMGGSALNWSEAQYIELLNKMAEKFATTRFVLTFGPSESGLAVRFREGLSKQASQQTLIYQADESASVTKLSALFACCEVVIAPSTGPLHLAVSRGKRVVTLFSPIRVQSALRWGPYVANDSAASVLVPENFCGEDFRCRLQACQYFPCMESISVNSVLDEVRVQLKLATNEKGKLA